MNDVRIEPVEFANIDFGNLGTTAGRSVVMPAEFHTAYIPPAVTPRVYLAGQALAAILLDGVTPTRMVAGEAVNYADAVLAKLEETK